MGAQLPMASAAAAARIEVTSLWGGAEAEAFQAVLDAFTEASGSRGRVHLGPPGLQHGPQQPHRAGRSARRRDHPGRRLPSKLRADDLIIPLADLGIDDAFLEGAYAPRISRDRLSVGKVGDTAYALMVKLNSKSTVWYRPDLFAEGGYEVPATWDDFIALTDQIDADGGTPLGWPGRRHWTLTDWFESIYIRQAGVEAYDTLFSAEGNWTDQSVKDAVTTMLERPDTDENIAGGYDEARWRRLRRRHRAGVSARRRR